MDPRKTRQRFFFGILGVGACFSGAALVTHIVAGLSLILALVFTGSILILAVGWVWRRSRPKERVRVIRYAKVGMLSGLVALVAYDLSKWGLSQLDPTPYNPFEAIRMFGVVLAGQSASIAVVYAAGIAFHVLNGVAFGIAFAFLFGHLGMIAGVVWGLFLESFQLVLYPGWLDIRFYEEFLLISGLSHAVFGAVLGLSCQYGLRQEHN